MREVPLKRARKKGEPFEVAREIALALPNVVEGFSYGTPAFRVGTKFLARLKEDGDSLVVRIPFEERGRLLGESPAIYYLTPHYDNYPAILVRLSAIGRTELRRVLEMAWRHVAPKKLHGEKARRKS
jgi:hypothetical protein